MNTQKIWQTNEGKLHPLVETFTVGEDYLLDQQLLPYDIHASIAHAEMLENIGILNKSELEQAKNGLQEILEKWQKNEFIILKEQEDGHTAIEQYLTEHCGTVGKKIHTGRSRNDQVLVMMRLFMKEKLGELKALIEKLCGAFEKQEAKSKGIPMPGYTHMQKAMPTTVACWLNSYASALEDVFTMIEATNTVIDQNPLGSASGFGIGNLKLDRDFTTTKLGFAKIQENPMYCGLSRGYFESIVLQTLSQPMMLSGKFANDMLLFTTQEFNFFSLPDEFTTGSSIMPQKRNYDLFEIMRGNVKCFHANQQVVQNIVASIGGGFQRDLQLTKKPFIEGVTLCLVTLELWAEVVNVLRIHTKTLSDAMTKDLYVTNQVYEMVKNGHTFRDAYLAVKRACQPCNDKH